MWPRKNVHRFLSCSFKILASLLFSTGWKLLTIFVLCLLAYWAKFGHCGSEKDRKWRHRSISRPHLVKFSVEIFKLFFFEDYSEITDFAWKLSSGGNSGNFEDFGPLSMIRSKQYPKRNLQLVHRVYARGKQKKKIRKKNERIFHPLGLIIRIFGMVVFTPTNQLCLDKSIVDFFSGFRLTRRLILGFLKGEQGLLATVQALQHKLKGK